MNFLYVECHCCRNADSARLHHGWGPKALTSRDAALALLLQESRGMWDDAKRAAYRAARREDESC